MRTRSERKLYIGNIEFDRIVTVAKEFGFGFILSALSVGGMTPFGLAYSTVAGNIGTAGALVGYFFFCDDAYRYVFAVLFCFIIKTLLCKKLPLSPAVNVFFFSVWGTLMSEILGVITVRYTFSENILFAFSGILSGISATVYFLALARPKRLNSNMKSIVFFCRSVLIATVIAGVASLDGIFVYSAYVIALLTLLVLGRHTVMVKTFAVGLVIDIFLLFTGELHYSMLGCIVAVVVVAGLLREFPAYLTAAACVIAALLILIYQKGSGVSWSNMLCVTVSVALLVALPEALTSSFAKIIIPASLSSTQMVKGRKKAYRTDGRVEINPVCDNCSRKFICWVRDHSYTSDAFIKLKESGFSDIPSHFEEHCSRIPELAVALSRSADSSVCSKMFFSKASAPKRGEKVCGDTASSFSVGNGKHAVCILDGMGSGNSAAKDSADYTVLLKKLLSHGIDKKEAVRFINEQLMNEKRERILGVDIMTVDLSIGYMETCKAGAASTYLIRGGKIYEFGATSLPVGVLEEVSADTNRCRIYSGDTVVMVSDGFSEKGGEWMGRRLFDRISSGITSCVDLAEALLSDACEEGLDVYDDLTVVTVKII